jgi:hypothetical protein
VGASGALLPHPSLAEILKFNFFGQRFKIPMLALRRRVA